MKNISQQTFRDILKRHREGNCTPEEEQFLEDWFSEVYTEPDIDSLPEQEQTAIREKMWRSIEDEVEPVESRDAGETGAGKRRFLTPAYYRMGIAACLLVALISLIYVLGGSRHSLSGEYSALVAGEASGREVVNLDVEPKEVALPDGSRITLQQNSKIVYPDVFASDRRSVYFEGEAFFEIAKEPSRPFFVYTKSVVTRVLGTSFLIKAFQEDQDVFVLVRTGKVSVYTRNDEEDGLRTEEQTILTPNQQAVYNKSRNTLSKSLVEEPQPLATKEALRAMHFENAPIADIFKALQDVYQVEIEFDQKAFASCKLTTNILDSSIFNRLEIICTAIKANYRVDGTRIVISGSGCGK